jgi:hypothetical protein
MHLAGDMEELIARTVPDLEESNNDPLSAQETLLRLDESVIGRQRTEENDSGGVAPDERSSINLRTHYYRWYS